MKICFLPYLFLLTYLAKTQSSILGDLVDTVDVLDLLEEDNVVDVIEEVDVFDVVDEEVVEEAVNDLDVLDILDDSSTDIHNFTQLATCFGYDSEEHTVVTSDGYILTIFRLFGRNCSAYSKTPVLLMHALWLSSETWIYSGPDISLGLLLADACFPIWFGNQRGTFYGRKHITLDPDTDEAFWKFSYDEMGVYDTPAFIDYILNQTGANSLNFIGYSQSAATFIAMCSVHPEYCTGEKVKLLITQAPGTFLSNITSTAFRLLVKAVHASPELFINLGFHRILQRGYITQDALSAFCSINLISSLCLGFADIVDDGTSDSISDLSKELFYNYFPDGTSVQNLIKIDQTIQSTFRWYDFEDEEKNIARYGSSSPPEYLFENVMLPTVIIRGMGDNVVNYKDAAVLAEKLPNVIDMIDVADSTWNHFDFVTSKNVPNMTYPFIYKYLNLYT